MEQQFDDIAAGERQWVPVIRDFFEPFERTLAIAQQEMKSVKGGGIETDLTCPTCDAPLLIKLGKRGEFLACSRHPDCSFTSDLERDSEGHIKLAVQPEIDDGDATCDKCGKPMVVKKSRYGMFLACTGYPDCKNTRDLKQTSEGTLAVAEATTQHMCDKCGKPMVEKKGRFGPFLGCTGYPECKNIVKLDRSGQPKPPPQITDELCPKCGKPMALKQGRYGPFLSCTGYPKCKTIKKLRKSRGASRRLIVSTDQVTIDGRTRRISASFCYAMGANGIVAWCGTTIKDACMNMDELLRRGVSEVIVESELRAKLASGRKLRFKQGFDPSKPDMHIGHAVGLRKLRQFQDLGHEVVLIVGDWTAQIGDPSGKDESRPRLDAATVADNARSYMEQFFRIVDRERTEVRWQSEWFGTFTLEGTFNLVGRFTLAQMLAHETFRKRYDSGRPITMLELDVPDAAGLRLGGDQGRCGVRRH